jgi:hypothetical protein
LQRWNGRKLNICAINCPILKHSPTQFMGEAGEARQARPTMRPFTRHQTHLLPAPHPSFCSMIQPHHTAMRACSSGTLSPWCGLPDDFAPSIGRTNIDNIDISTKELSSGAWIYYIFHNDLDHTFVRSCSVASVRVTRGEECVATGGPVL